jgi:hypothetical protein
LTPLGNETTPKAVSKSFSQSLTKLVFIGLIRGQEEVAVT